MNDYSIQGFPGCIGSMDVVHVSWIHCNENLKQYHNNRKGQTTRAYEVIVNNNRRCLSCTKGFFGSFNDKTIVKFDQSVQRIHRKEIYHDIEFDIFDENGEVSTLTGLYLLSDNGYHHWRCLQFPNKILNDMGHMYYRQWSKRLESIRKDVECFFGIMKKRFVLLTYGVRLQKCEQMDNLMLTCCILHNMLQEWDDIYHGELIDQMFHIFLCMQEYRVFFPFLVIDNT